MGMLPLPPARYITCNASCFLFVCGCSLKTGNIMHEKKNKRKKPYKISGENNLLCDVHADNCAHSQFSTIPHCCCRLCGQHSVSSSVSNSVFSYYSALEQHSVNHLNLYIQYRLHFTNYMFIVLQLHFFLMWWFARHMHSSFAISFLLQLLSFVIDLFNNIGLLHLRSIFGYTCNANDNWMWRLFSPFACADDRFNRKRGSQLKAFLPSAMGLAFRSTCMTLSVIKWLSVRETVR